MQHPPPIFVPARMNSRRLPGKPLRVIAGKPLLHWLVDSLQHVGGAGSVVIATSDQPLDDAIATWCAERGVACHRGPLDDVAGRLIGAALRMGAEAFVRVSGDSPLMDPALVARAIKLFDVGNADLVTNVQQRTFPKGFSVEVISVAALQDHLSRHGGPSDREHVTTSFYAHPADVRIVNFTSGVAAGDVQLSVDDEEDFIRVERLLNHQRSGDRCLDWRQTYDLHCSFKQRTM